MIFLSKIKCVLRHIFKISQIPGGIFCILTCDSRTRYISIFVNTSNQLAHLRIDFLNFYCHVRAFLRKIRLGCVSRTTYSSHHALSGTTVHL